MKNLKRKIITIILIITSIITIEINAEAHSGRTDANGGHRDNKNKSGLGSYHYHCGGHPAHLHTNGVCPYSSKSSSSSSKKSSNSKNKSTKSSSSSESKSASEATSKQTSTVPVNILAESININENITEIYVGKDKKLTATISPDNTTDKNITWKSSDESIATVSAIGEISAKKPGVVEINASTSNGKVSVIKIIVKEQEKIQNTEINNTNTIAVTKTDKINTTAENSSKSVNPVLGVLAIGLIGLGSFLGYKEYKMQKKS